MQSVLHPWAAPPLTLPCPTPPPGQEGPPTGFFDPDSLGAAYHLSALVWIATMLLLVLVCYLTARASLNRGFVLKWYAYWLVAVLLGAVVPLVVLSLAPEHALAGTCSPTDPLPFAARLTFDQILPAMLDSAVWSFVAYPVVSLLLTAGAGRHPAAGGFFHYRGCPWPRWNPFAP